MATQARFSACKIFSWLDQNLLLVLAGFLLAFIPLYPKLPLFSPIEEYIVRIRLEDIVVFFTLLAWLIQFARHKIKWRTPLTWFILAYALVGLLTLVSAIWVIETVPLLPNHILKSALHYLRYLEYFSLFFVVYASVNDKRSAQILLWSVSLTLLSIIIYGYGQKYHYWPVYSTMNREFSKGVRLYLTEHARVQSTFAGHYDLAAYLVIVMPLVLAFAYQAENKFYKWSLFSLHGLGLWLLIMSAARTSFAAYAVASTLVIGLFGLRQVNWRERIKWFASRFAALWLLAFILMASFGADIYERFAQVIESYPAIETQFQAIENTTHHLTGQVVNVFKPSGEETPRKTPPPNSISTQEAAVIVASDERPATKKPSDVYTDIPDQVKVSTLSADGTTQTITIEKPRVWSDNALRYGLSVAIRLDTLWPRAIEGFLRNPLFGSGYATLNKTSLTDFTTADSTDNNFLRTLGETGLLGFITFYGTVGAGLWLACKGMKKEDLLLIAFSIGYFSASLGLLLNALYIDVFAASKVAFTYWALSGLFVAYYRLVVMSQSKKHDEKNAH